MRDFYVLDIPIYLWSQERYYAEMEERVERHLQWCFEEQGIARESADPETRTRIAGHMKESFGGPWKFNQVVGWVCLFVEDHEVGAHVWRVNGKRFHRKMKKVFYLTTPSNCLPAYFPVDADSMEIFKIVLVALEESAKEYAKRKRYLDLANFRRVGPYIDWRRMMEDVTARDGD